MADGQGIFEFETNADTVVAQIIAALRKLQTEVNKRTKGTDQDTAKGLRNSAPELGNIAGEAIKDLDRLNAAAESGKISAQDLQKSYQNLLTTANRKLGEALAKRQIPVDIALDFRNLSLAELDRRVKASFKDAAASGISDFSQQLAALRTPSNLKSDFTGGYNAQVQQQNVPTPPLQPAQPPGPSRPPASANLTDDEGDLAESQIAELRQRDAQRRQNFKDLISETGNFQDGVFKSTSGTIVDAREAVVRLFKDVNGGFEEIESQTQEFTAALRGVLRDPNVTRGISATENKVQREGVQEVQAAQENRNRYNKQYVDAQRALIAAGTLDPSKINQLNASTIIDRTTDGVTRVFKVTGDALELLAQNSERAQAALRTEAERANRSSGSSTDTADQRAGNQQIAALQESRNRYNKQYVDQQRALIAAGTVDPSKLVQLNPTTIIDRTTDGVERVFKVAGQGLELLAADSEKALAALRQDANKSTTGTSAASKAALQGLYSGRGQLDDGVTALGAGYFKDIRDGTERYFQRIGDGLREVTQDADRLYTALQKEAALNTSKAEASQRQGVSGNFLHGLLSGGFGGQGTGGLDGLALSAGTTLKYTALYSALGALQTVLSQAVAQTLNYADSNTNLAIALENTGESADDAQDGVQGMLNSLSAISTLSGGNVGDVMDVAARGIRLLGENSGYSKDQIQKFGVEFARQANIMATLAKTDVKDAYGNLAAIQSSFDLGPTSSTRINDAIVTAKNLGGGDEKETAQALASFGAAAAQAGFSLEQAAVLASRVQAATDQSGEAVGNKLSKLVSIASGSAGQSAISALNNLLPGKDQIDTSAAVADQLIQLSKVYPTLAEAQRKQLLNTLGGTSATREAIIALNDLYPLVTNNGKSITQAGAAAAEFQKRLHDLTVQVKTLQGAATDIIVNLNNSHAFDPLAFAFEGFVKVVKGIDALIQDFNNVLPSGLRQVLSFLIQIGAALLLIGKISKAGGIKSFLGSAEAAINPAAAEARAALAARQAAAAGTTVASTVAGTTTVAEVEKNAATIAATTTTQTKGVVEAYEKSVVAATAASQALVEELAAKTEQIAAVEAARLAEQSAAATEASVAASAFYAQQLSLLRAQQAGLTASVEAQKALSAAGAAGAIETASGGVVEQVTQTESESEGPSLDEGIKQSAETAEATENARDKIKEGSGRFGAAAKRIEDATSDYGRSGKIFALGAKGLLAIGASLLDPVNIAIGAFIAFGALRSKAHEISEAVESAEQTGKTLQVANNQAAPNSGTSSETTLNTFKDVSSEAATGITNIQASTKGVTATVAKALGISQTDTGAAIKELRTQKATADSAIAILSKESNLTAENFSKASDLVLKFGDSAHRLAQTITDDIKEMQDAGIGSGDILSSYLTSAGINDKTGRPLTGAELKPIDSGGEAVGYAGQLANNLGKTLFGGKIQVPLSIVTGEQNPDPFKQGQAFGRLTDEDNPMKNFLAEQQKAVQEALADVIPKNTAAKGGKLTPEQLAKIKQTVRDKVIPNYTEEFEKQDASVQAAILSPEALGENLDKSVDSFFANRNVTSSTLGPATRSGTDVTEDIINNLIPNFDKKIAALKPGDTKGLVRLEKIKAEAIRTMIKQAAPGQELYLGQAEEEYNKARIAYSNDYVARSEDLRKAEQARAKSTKDINAIGKKYLTREVGTAAATNNIDLLKNIFANATKSEVQAIRDIIAEQKKADEAKLKHEQDVAAAANASNPDLLDQNPAVRAAAGAKSTTDVDPALQHKIKTEGKQLDNIDTAAGDTAFATDSAYTGSAAVQDAQEKAQTAAELLIAKRNANALADAKLDSMQRAVADAKTRLDAYKVKDAAYYGALATYNAAKGALATYIAVDRANQTEQLGIDLTNPVQQAKAARDNANRALAAAKKAASQAGLKGAAYADAIYDETIEQRTQQAAYENSKQQEFINSLQTAESLGNISHKTYINYLTAELKRTEDRIKTMKKTDTGYYQAVQYANTIKQDLKSAADEIDSQFNIGDIKLPTPYEVRRAIKAKTDGAIASENGAFSMGGNVNTDNSTKNVILNGVPIQQVLTIIQDLFGVKARSVAAKKVV